MTVTAFNGVPGKDGDTGTLIGHLLREIVKKGIETEFVRLSVVQKLKRTAHFPSKHPSIS